MQSEHSLKTFYRLSCVPSVWKTFDSFLNRDQAFAENTVLQPDARFFFSSSFSRLNGIQTLVPLILVHAVGQQTEHSHTLQVAVATGENKHTAYFLVVPNQIKQQNIQ